MDFKWLPFKCVQLNRLSIFLDLIQIYPCSSSKFSFCKWAHFVQTLLVSLEFWWLLACSAHYALALLGFLLEIGSVATYESQVTIEILFGFFSDQTIANSCEYRSNFLNWVDLKIVHQKNWCCFKQSVDYELISSEHIIWATCMIGA